MAKGQPQQSDKSWCILGGGQGAVAAGVGIEARRAFSVKLNGVRMRVNAMGMCASVCACVLVRLLATMISGCA